MEELIAVTPAGEGDTLDGHALAHDIAAALRRALRDGTFAETQRNLQRLGFRIELRKIKGVDAGRVSFRA